MKRLNNTSHNNGHTATLRSAQIGSLRSPTSYVRQALSAIANKEMIIWREK